MADSTSKTCKFDWLYPELLSKEGLIEILSQRFVKLPENVEATLKEELLELYHKYILPRPQRQYRLNRRGRDMTRKQIAMAKKRKNVAEDSNQPPEKRTQLNASSQLLSSFDGGSPGTRLKPPPSCVNFEKKVIKLNSSKSAGKSSCSPSVATTNSSDASPLSKKTKLKRSSAEPAAGEIMASATLAPQMNKRIKQMSSHLSRVDVNDKRAAPNSTDNNKVTEKGPTMEASPEANDKRKFLAKKISWP